MPGIPSLEEGGFACARCGLTLVVPQTSPLPRPSGDDARPEGQRPGRRVTAASTASDASLHPPSYDGWAADEELRHIRRLLRSGTKSANEAEAPRREKTYRLDASQSIPRPPTSSSLNRRSVRRGKARSGAVKATRTPGDQTLAVLAWSTLSLGTMGFVCGVALLAWSMSSGRQELWAVGAPVLFVGQICLVMGLFLQLDRIWRDGRRAAAKFDSGEQINDLKRTNKRRRVTEKG